VSTLPANLFCPECGGPAEVTERFGLPSTDGPISHVAISCAAEHHFRMPADGLPGRQSSRQSAQRDALVTATGP